MSSGKRGRIGKRGRRDDGAAFKVEETESDTDTLWSIRDTDEAHYSYRDAPPAHYTLKIDCFSKFRDAMVKDDKKCYTSEIFEAGGYKWKLSIYPKGDEARNGKGHISMYLIIEDTKSLPYSWEVNVVYKFFVLDQLRYKFLEIEDAVRRLFRFNTTKTEWGIGKLISCSDFEDNRNGFLIQDTCVFGVEVSIIPCNTSVGECISSVKVFRDCTYKWEIHPFSSYPRQQDYKGSVTKDYYVSDIFTAGNFKWNLQFYPKGNSTVTDNSPSLYLYANGLDAQTKVYAQYKLCIQDQRGAKNQEFKASHWFTSSCANWGSWKLLSFDDFNDPSRGFLVNDTVIIEVHVTHVFTANSVSLF